MNSDRRVLTVAEAAVRTPFSTKTILRALVARELVGSKVRNRWLIRPKDLDAWLDSGRRDTVTATGSPRPSPVGSAERLRAIEEAA
jgi:excisionase family DNA binding protein